MKWFSRRLLALLLVAAICCGLVGALPAQASSDAFTQADYAALDPLWDGIAALEQEAQAAPYAARGPEIDVSHRAAALVMQSDTYVPGSLCWQGDAFTWMTKSGIACQYSPRLRELDRQAASEVEAEVPALPALEEGPAARTAAAGSREVVVIGPYYGIDEDFSNQYIKEAASIADTIHGTYTVYQGAEANIDTIADALERAAVVFFDSHGDTNYRNPANSKDSVTGATSSYLCLQSGEGLTAADYNQTGNVRHALYAGKSTANPKMHYYLVDGTAIANHMEKENAGGLLWMAICLGMATDGLYRPIQAKGVDTVYGYSQSVTFFGDYFYEKAFWYAMKKGESVAAAAEFMKSFYGDWDPYYSFGDSDTVTTVEQARRKYCAFPIVVSQEDPYPGKGAVDGLQMVKSTWKLPLPTFTAVSADTGKGTVQVDGTKVTVQAAAGYLPGMYTVEPQGAAVVTQAAGQEPVFEISHVTEDCTITFQFVDCPHLHTALENARPATDTTPGYTGDSVCRDCGMVVETGHKIPVIVCDHAHTSLQNKKDATYTQTGYSGDVVCDDCGMVIQPGQLRPMLACPHGNKEVQDAVAATYTEKGYSGDVVCADCGQVLETGSVIPVLVCPHKNMEVRNAVAATHTAAGYSGDLVCADCQKKLQSGTALPIACPGLQYDDMPSVGNWAHDGLDHMIANGLFNGISQREIAPQAHVTRAMLVTVLWRMDGAQATTRAGVFQDVAAGAWYADAVCWAAEHGIVNGVSAGRFDPDGKVTREQIAAILYRYTVEKGQAADVRASLAQFPDQAGISAYARQALSWANAAGLIHGVDQNGVAWIQPKANATREQIAAIFMRYAA